MDIPTVCAIGEQYIAAMAIGEHNAAKTCDLLYTRVGVREVMKRNNNNNHAMTYLMVSISPGLRYHPFPMRMGIKVLGEFAHGSIIKPQKTEEEGRLVLWEKRLRIKTLPERIHHRYTCDSILFTKLLFIGRIVTLSG